MVIGKDKKRIIALEEKCKELSQKLDDYDTRLSDALNIIKQLATNSDVKELDTKLNELSITVENGFEDGKIKKTPQQLVKEWFEGGDDNA